MNYIEEISKCEISINDTINLLDYNELNPLLLLVQGYSAKAHKVYANDTTLNIINDAFSYTFNSNQSTKKISHLKRINIKNYNKLYNEYLKKGKNFILSKFSLHDIFSLNNGINLTSPFNINISREKGNYIYGELDTVFNEIDIDEYEVLFRNLSLPLLISNILPSIYSHEIIHTQIMSLFGSVNNYLNNEVLPIFIELLYNYENNICSKYRINNLQTIITYINKESTINTSSFNDMLYYVSIITAYKLLNIYVKGNNLVKEEIISNIQSVFDNKFTVEEFLNRYDLDWTKKRVMI